MTADVCWGIAANTFMRGTPGEIEEMLGMGPAAEAAGFDSIWIGDHVLWKTPLLDGMTLLSAYAGTTERITLGTGILLLGLRQPAVGVRIVTSLNAISGGRFILGVGGGGENPAEFEACEVPLRERGRRLDAALQLLRSQWEESSELPRFEPTGPQFPIWIGGRSDAARRRVTRYGDGWLHAFVSAKRVAEETDKLAAESGRRPTTALHVYMRVGEDEAQAATDAAEFLRHNYAMDSAPLMRYTVHGSAESCTEQLHAFVEAGVEHFVLRPAGWDQRAQLDHWGERLLPLLRERSGAGASSARASA